MVRALTFTTLLRSASLVSDSLPLPISTRRLFRCSIFFSLSFRLGGIIYYRSGRGGYHCNDLILPLESEKTEGEVRARFVSHRSRTG